MTAPSESVLTLLLGVSAVILACRWSMHHALGRGRRATPLRTTIIAPGVDRVRSLSAVGFERWVARQFQQAGFLVAHSGGRGDHGVDLFVQRNGVQAVVQCKRFRNQLVQESVLRDLYGAMHAANLTTAYAVTTHRFSEGALRWASGKCLILWDAFTIEHLANAEVTRTRSVPRPAPTVVCRCGGMQIRSMRQRGWVLGCTRYPRCRRVAVI
jgi:restriction system protein